MFLKVKSETVSTPFENNHTTTNIDSHIKLINSVKGESSIVIEKT